MSLASFNLTRLAKPTLGSRLPSDHSSGSPLDASVSSPIEISEPSSDGPILNSYRSTPSLSDGELLMEAILEQSNGQPFRFHGPSYDLLIQKEFTNLKCGDQVFPTFHSVIDYSLSHPIENRSFCTTPSDISNPNIPLHERALYFITLNPFFLETPGASRPCKSILQPSNIPYPYCAAVALAHDYLTALKAQPSIYYKLISSLQGTQVLDADELAFLELAPLLYYLGIKSPEVIIENPSTEVSELPSAQEGVEASVSEKSTKRKRVAQEGPVKIFKCEGEGCVKVYKQPNGLKYHLASGKCVGNPGVPVKPFKCDVSSCSFSSITQSALKQHKKKHLKVDASASEVKVDAITTPVIDDQVSAIDPAALSI